MALTVVLMLLIGGCVTYVHAKRPENSKGPDWTEVPYQIAGWTGINAQLDPLLGFDPADSSLLRIYHRTDADPVVVYAGFHWNVPKTLEDHEPDQCYPAQGWKITNEKKIAIGNFRGYAIQGKEMQVEKNGDHRLVVWWFNVGDHPFENRMRQVYRLMLTSMFDGHSDGTIVRVETPLENGEVTQAHLRALTFSRALLGNLQTALPN